MSAAILNIENVSLSIGRREVRVPILGKVSFKIPRGKIVGLVGESGSGKSTIARAILGILPENGNIDSGSIEFEGRDLTKVDKKTFRRDIRGSKIGFIPQDPFLSFNPVFTVGQQLTEVMRWHAPEVGGRPNSSGALRRLYSRSYNRALGKDLARLFDAVRIPDAANALHQYPHQFSGGQRQRMLIAAALACKPSLLIADEPTTALDVTTQQGILELLRELVAEYGLSMLFVTHDFGVVSQLCDEVCVLHGGKTVETGKTDEVLNRPRHSYTQSLLASHPDRSGVAWGRQ